jgi:hypothetical protein
VPKLDRIDTSRKDVPALEQELAFRTLLRI